MRNINVSPTVNLPRELVQKEGNRWERGGVARKGGGGVKGKGRNGVRIEPTTEWEKKDEKGCLRPLIRNS